MKIFLTFAALFLFTQHIHAQRNVVLIIADDLGLEYCGFYENHADTVIMPNVRTLLEKGIRFTNAWSNPLCSPTRAGIFTGRYSFRTGVGDAVGGQTSNTLDTSEMTIPRMLEIFKPNGIAKANIGKWHLHNPMPQSNFVLPIKMGYDYYEGNFSGQLPNYYAWNKIKNNAIAPCSTYATIETTNNAIAWIQSIPKSKPMFLWLAYNAPHTPFNLPPSNLHSYSKLTGTPADTATSVVPYYKAMCEALDREIGRLFDSLKAVNRFDSTDFIFIGDNGSDPRVYQGSGRAKGSVYQDGICVPFIIAGPTIKNPGRVSQALVNTQDIFATIIELFGYTDWKNNITRPVDSKSLLPIINDLEKEVRPWVFSEVFKNTPVASDGKTMRNAEYKLLDFDNGSQKFFNLVNDPDEMNDLLLRALTDIEKTNYTYLCNEMSLLTGKGGFCTATGIGEYSDIPAFSFLVDEHFSMVRFTNPTLCFNESTIECHDAKGNLVIHQSLNISANPSINIGYLPSGMYTFTLHCAEHTYNNSLLIKR